MHFFNLIMIQTSDLKWQLMNSRNNWSICFTQRNRVKVWVTENFTMYHQLSYNKQHDRTNFFFFLKKKKKKRGKKRYIWNRACGTQSHPVFIRNFWAVLQFMFPTSCSAGLLMTARWTEALHFLLMSLNGCVFFVFDVAQLRSWV